MKSKTKEITNLIKICLDIANIADRKGEEGNAYLEDLGLGYRALSISLRQGAKAVIDLQDDYSKALEEKTGGMQKLVKKKPGIFCWKYSEIRKLILSTKMTSRESRILSKTL